MGLTVREALNLPVLTGSKVLAGRQGLDREITGVTVIDAPDGLRFIRGGEFILSTLFLYRESPSDQLTLVDELHNRRAAALGIKERFVNTISSYVSNQADEWQIPVIQLPGLVAWADVINSILKESLGRQAKELEQSWRIHREFVDIALEGRGLKALVDSLAEMVGRPVFLKETCTGDVFSAGDYQSIRAGIRLSENEGGPGYGYSGEGLSPRGPERGSGESQVGPWLTASGEHVQSISGHSGITRICSKGEGAPRVVCPVRSGRHFGGWIVVWEERWELDDWGLIALQHAATVAALEVEKLRALDKLKRSMRDDFLYHLLNGDFQTEVSVRERAWELGWGLADAYVVVVFKGASTSSSWLDEEGGRAAWRVVDMLQKCGLPRQSLVGVDHAERPLLMYPVPNDSRLYMADQEVTREVGRLVGVLRQTYRHFDLLAGIGRPRCDILTIKESYREATAALELAPTVPGKGPVMRYRDLGVYRLVRNGPNPGVAEFVRDIIGPLIEHDRQHGTQLVMTLKVFLENGSNYREAARALYLHHNTIRYRLSKVEEICGINLNSWRDRFNLQLAICLSIGDNLSS